MRDLKNVLASFLVNRVDPVSDSACQCLFDVRDNVVDTFYTD